MAETDLSDWLSITDAATRIGCSTRTIERLARARKLESRLRPQAGSPPVVVYHPDDVARIATERHPEPPPFVLPAVGNGNGHGRELSGPSGVSIDTRVLLTSKPGDDPIARFFALLCSRLQSPPSPPVAESVSERPVLTLDEAVAASGWSRTYLLRKIHNGTLKAEKDRGWKIRRKDLEAL